ncbi:MAG: hypothetical protein LBM01_03625 [Christensenellaceae bacterium]|jgi:membrane protein YdbS with pleckstrin-like domain|nr:hypothetical protein [Christensenellaceae bacterium]
MDFQPKQLSKQQIFAYTQSALFLVGAAFMLTYSLAGLGWALWVGIGFMALALATWVVSVVVITRDFKKTYKRVKEEAARIKAEQEKSVETTATEVKTEEPAKQ